MQRQGGFRHWLPLAMIMRIATEVGINWINEDDEESAPQSEMLLYGVVTGKPIPGAKLEAAVQWGRYYLLFTVDGDPYEEVLSIILVDEHMQQLDVAYMGVPYSSGVFSGLVLQEPDTVRFEFFGEGYWTVRLLSKARLGMPLIGETFGAVWRPFKFTRHFVIHNHKPQAKRR